MNRAAGFEAGAPADEAGQDLGEVRGEEAVGAAIGGSDGVAGGVGAEADAEVSGEGEAGAGGGAGLVERVAFDDTEQAAHRLGQIGEDSPNRLPRPFVRRVAQVKEGGAAAGVEGGAPLAAVGFGAVKAGFGEPDVGHHLGVEVDEAVVARDDEGGALEDPGAFGGVADRPDRPVGGGNGPPGAVRLPAVCVLGGIGRDQVQRQQSRPVGFQNVRGYHAGRVVTGDVGGGVVAQVEAARCLPLQFLPEARRSALAHRQQAVGVGVEGVDLRDEPVDRCADRHRPGDRRGPPAGRAHGVPQGGNLDRRFVPVPLATLAGGFEGPVVVDAVPGGQRAGDDRRMRGVGDGRKHAPYALGVGTVAGHLLHVRRRPVGAGDIEIRPEAVHRDEHDVVRSWLGGQRNDGQEEGADRGREVPRRQGPRSPPGNAGILPASAAQRLPEAAGPHSRKAGLRHVS